ncbi:MAG: hypothetical protein MJ204_05445 [Bacteroidales bacterium]|nr:hypothetical protein [Bacteroidales bacterium]
MPTYQRKQLLIMILLIPSTWYQTMEKYQDTDLHFARKRQEAGLRVGTENKSNVIGK